MPGALILTEAGHGAIAEGNETGLMQPSTDDTLAQGTRFGNYSIVRQIGSGGMGAVYEATHTRLKKRVALKVLHKSVATSADAVARFMREGESAARLRHPHVVDITDLGVESGTPFLVMELLEGESLGSVLDREGRLTPSRIADCMLPVLAAVATAHADAIVHRDLKPENVFLAKTRVGTVVPKLLDFGISKVNAFEVQGALTATGALLGTPAYMSPEQVKGSREVDARSDQYALGVILYECSTGKRPYDSDHLYQLLRAIAEDDCPPARTFCPELPQEFEKLISRAMSREPSDRFSSVRRLGAAMLPFATAETRATWSSFFIPTDDDARKGAATPDATRAPMLSEGEHATIVASPRSRVSDPGVLSTIGASVREAIPVDPAPSPRSRRMGILVIAASLAVAAITASLVTRARRAPDSPREHVARTAVNAAAIPTSALLLSPAPVVAPIAAPVTPLPAAPAPAIPVPVVPVPAHEAGPAAAPASTVRVARERSASPVVPQTAGRRTRRYHVD